MTPLELWIEDGPEIKCKGSADSALPGRKQDGMFIFLSKTHA